MCCCDEFDCSAWRLQLPGWCGATARCPESHTLGSTYINDELPFIKVEVPMCLPHAACIHTHAATWQKQRMKLSGQPRSVGAVGSWSEGGGEAHKLKSRVVAGPGAQASLLLPLPQERSVLDCTASTVSPDSLWKYSRVERLMWVGASWRVWKEHARLKNSLCCIVSPHEKEVSPSCAAPLSP